ncbi:ribonuclease H-like domain-containing protein [Tanacetum coccineum]
MNTTQRELILVGHLWMKEHCLNVGYTFVNFTTSEVVWKSLVCITRKSWPLFKSKKIAQVVRAWIQSKNSLVKHFEDMRLCRPSKEYLLVWFDPPRDESMSCLTIKGMRNNGAKCARHITAKVAGKFVSISEASIRTDLIFDDADGIDSLPNQAIFDAIQLMGYEGDLTVLTFNKALFSPQWRHLEAKKKFVMYPRFISIFLGKVTPLFDTMLVQPTQDEGASSERLSDEQPSPSPAPTSEVPNESLPDSSSAQPSEVPFEQQPDPSPRPSPRPSPKPSPTPIVTDSIPEPTGENLGDHSSNDTSLSGNEDDMTLQNVYDLCISLCKQVSDQAKEIKLLKAKITKLKKQAKPVIKHHKEYLKSVSLQQRFPRKSFSKKHRVHKESVSKQGRKKAKGESSVQRDPLFDVMPEDKIDHMETENAQSKGRTREMVDEDKEFDEDRLSTEDVVSTDKEGVSTDFEKVSTDKPKVSTDGSKVSTDKQEEGTEEIFEGTEEQREGTEEKVESTAGQIKGSEDQSKEEIASQTSTQTPTSMIFGDDETIATLLINMSKAKAAFKEKEKGVELKDVEEIDKPRPTSTRSLLTLKPLPKIDTKDKGKKKIEEEDESKSEDDDIPQAVKKFKQLESDEELARKIQEEWEAEEERNKIAEEKATNEALIKNFDDIKARIEADRILAEKLQEQEREQFTIEERAKFLHDTIAAQRKFLAQQRSEAIRNRPPTKNQLRNQMMTFLKHVGNFKHSELKSKKFEDIQAMYEKIKRSDEDFIAIGSVEDDRLIKRMNKKDSSKGEEIKQEVKKEDKGEENTRKRKHGTRKKMKSRKRRFKQDTSQDDPSDIEKENDELRLCLTIAPDEDKEVDYEILDKKYPIIDWKTENLGTKPQFDESKRSEEINMNVVTRSNGQKRCFSTLIRVLSVFDREDLDAVYKLVMDIYQDKIPEGFDKVLWGDLIVMFNPDEQDEFWNSQHEWKVVSWKLHSSSGVHTLMTDEGLVVHMLIEKKYPLKKEILMQMLKLKLESEEESTMALELIRFIKKSWLVQDQTVLGKDYSNLLIADSLLKTIWFINAPCYDNEALASPNTNDEELSIPEQTATGKGTSNPLMAAPPRTEVTGVGSSVNITDPYTSTSGLHSTNVVKSSIHNVINTRPISYINVVSPTSFAQNASSNKNGSEKVGHELVNEFPSSYANNLSPTSLTKANRQKLDANVPNDADFDIWLPLASVHEVNVKMQNSLYGYFIGKRLAFLVMECSHLLRGVDSMLRDSPWLIRGVLIFLNKWSPSNHGGGNSYARILIETDVCNGFNNNLVMTIPKLEERGYTKETIRVEYEWKPPRCSTCLIFGHSVDDCPKASKRVVNMVDKGKGGSFEADDEGFIDVKKKKSSEVSTKTASLVGKKNVSISGNSSKKTNMMNTTTSSNGTFSLRYSFEAMNVDDPIIMEVESGNKASMSSAQEEGNSSTPLIEKIHRFEKQLLEGKCVLVDEDGKSLEMDDYSGDLGSDDEVEPGDNEMASFLAKPSRVGYGTKSLLEQWRETYSDAEQECDYDPYDDDIYEGQVIPGNNQTIFNNLDIKVRGDYFDRVPRKLLKRQSRHTRIIKKEEEEPLDGEFVKVKKETTEVDDDVSHPTRTLPVEDDKSSVTEPSREVLEAFKEQASLTKEKAKGASEFQRSLHLAQASAKEWGGSGNMSTAIGGS